MGSIHTLVVDVDESEGDLFLVRRWLAELTHKEIIYYCHNLTFDGILLLPLLYKLVEVTKVVYGRGKDLHLLEFRRKDADVLIQLRCTYKLFPASLEKLANLCKLPTSKISFPFTLLRYTHIKQKFVSVYRDQFISDTAYLTFKNMWGDVVNLPEAIKHYSRLDVELLRDVFNICQHTLKKINIDVFSRYTLSALAHLDYFPKLFNNPPQLSQVMTKKYLIKTRHLQTRPINTAAQDTDLIHVYNLDSIVYNVLNNKGLNMFPAGVAVELYPQKVEEPGFYTIEYSCASNIPVLLNHHGVEGTGPHYNSIGTFWFEEILAFIENGGTVNSIHRALIFKKYVTVELKRLEELNSFISISPIARFLGIAILQTIKYPYTGGTISQGSIAETHNNDYETSIPESAITWLSVYPFMQEIVNSKSRILQYKLISDLTRKPASGNLVLFNDKHIIVSFSTRSHYLVQFDTDFNWSRDYTKYSSGLFLNNTTYSLHNKAECGTDSMDLTFINNYKVNNLQFKAMELAFRGSGVVTLRNQLIKSSIGNTTKYSIVTKTWTIPTINGILINWDVK